jgi:hypothetical protein
MSSKNAPLVLCRVCSLWRGIALDTPRLWATVAITIRPRGDPVACRDVVTAWLERSRALPLTLYLKPKVTWCSIGIEDPILDAILPVVFSHSYRWQQVFIHLAGNPPLSFHQLDTPILRSFTLTGTRREDKAIPFPFSNTPHLKQLHWPFSIDIPASPQIPWNQISNLCISGGMTLFAALEAIRLCPQLEEFDVNIATVLFFNWERDSRLPLNPVVENRSLRVLKILTYRDCSPFLNSLTLPALNKFTFKVVIADEYCAHGPREMVPEEHQAFLDLLTRSGCQLERLKIGHCAFTAPAILQCLEHKSLETIQALTIANHYYLPIVSKDTLARLTIPSPSRVLLPMLTDLTLEMCLGRCSGALGEMVYSRRCLWEKHGTAQLKSFSVESNLSNKDYDLISKAASDGLKTSILSDPDACHYGYYSGSDNDSDGGSDN